MSIMNDVPDRNWSPKCTCGTEERLRRVNEMLNKLLDQTDALQLELNGELDEVEAKRDEISKRTSLKLSELRAAIGNIQDEVATVAGKTS
jgi:hypothetical protein